MVLLTKNRLIAARDPHGFRPLALGQLGDAWIVCSETCADFYNPKVISASMGSFARVNVHYLNLAEWLQQHTGTFPIYGASLAGENIHAMHLKPEGIVVMGNEANGIRPEVASSPTQPAPGR